MTLPLANRIDLMDQRRYYRYEPVHYDGEGYERTERLNGAYQCPKCGLWWPVIEEPDMWVELADGRWRADGWWGAAACESCRILMLDQPDGRSECYQLPADARS